MAQRAPPTQHSAPPIWVLWLGACSSINPQGGWSYSYRPAVWSSSPASCPVPCPGALAKPSPSLGSSQWPICGYNRSPYSSSLQGEQRMKREPDFGSFNIFNWYWRFFFLQQITKLVGLETLPQKLVNMACNHTKWGWKLKIFETTSQELLRPASTWKRSEDTAVYLSQRPLAPCSTTV